MDYRSVQPSRDAEAILRASGWSPDRRVDVREWVDRLRRDGNQVSPVTEAILENFGGLRLEHKLSGGMSRYDLSLNPASWYGERDRVRDIEETLKSPACPLGEFSGDAMLAILEDGRVVSAFDGDIDLVGVDWPTALDLITLGRGEFVRLAMDYVLVEHK
jgi:hypothetical protein